MSLTYDEKIALAESEIKQADNMVAFSRLEVQKWVNKLEVRQEYLDSLQQSRKAVKVTAPSPDKEESNE